MINCWDELPENRPTFTELCTELEAMLSANKPYLDLMNIENTPEYMNLGSDSEDETAEQMPVGSVPMALTKKSSQELETCL